MTNNLKDIRYFLRGYIKAMEVENILRVAKDLKDSSIGIPVPKGQMAEWSKAPA